MSVCCECCVLSGRCLCEELITRPEELCQLWCVVVCGLEQCFSTAGPRPGTWSWHQLYRAARDSPGIDN